MGDFNIDWKNEGDTYSNRIKKCVTDMGMLQVVGEYTHIMGNSRSMIDLVITNDRNLQAIVLDQPGYTNHRAIGVEMSMEVNSKKFTKVRKIIFSKDHARELLSGVKWNYRIKDINEKFNDMVAKIFEVRDLIMPEREIVVNNNRT